MFQFSTPFGSPNRNPLSTPKLRAAIAQASAGFDHHLESTVPLFDSSTSSVMSAFSAAARALAPPATAASDQELLTHAASDESDLAVRACGRVSVNIKIYGFHRFRKPSGKVMDSFDLEMPAIQYSTMGAWITVPLSVKRNVTQAGLSFRGMYKKCFFLGILLLYRLPYERFFPQSMLLFFLVMVLVC